MHIIATSSAITSYLRASTNANSIRCAVICVRVLSRSNYFAAADCPTVSVLNRQMTSGCVFYEFTCAWSIFYSTNFRNGTVVAAIRHTMFGRCIFAEFCIGTISTKRLNEISNGTSCGCVLTVGKCRVPRNASFRHSPFCWCVNAISKESYFEAVRDPTFRAIVSALFCERIPQGVFFCR